MRRLGPLIGGKLERVLSIDKPAWRVGAAAFGGARSDRAAGTARPGRGGAQNLPNDAHSGLVMGEAGCLGLGLVLLV
ncbi:hypothetical protein RhoFasSB10_03944 [Rhodococcus fascians]|nr:hypothetical protein [Rhodococcus fascians]